MGWGAAHFLFCEGPLTTKVLAAMDACICAAADTISN